MVWDYYSSIEDITYGGTGRSLYARQEATTSVSGAATTPISNVATNIASYTFSDINSPILVSLTSKTAPVASATQTMTTAAATSGVFPPTLDLDPSLADFLDRINATSTIDSYEFGQAIEESYAEAEKTQTLDGFDYITLFDNSGDYILASVGNGNLGLDTKDNAAVRLWASDSQIVVGAGSENPLFYFPDEM